MLQCLTLDTNQLSVLPDSVGQLEAHALILMDVGVHMSEGALQCDQSRGIVPDVIIYSAAMNACVLGQRP